MEPNKQNEELDIFFSINKNSPYQLSFQEEPVGPSFMSSALTRNKYGAVVLNSDGVMFLDPDVPPDQPKGEAYESIRARLLDTGLAFRVYKTTAGFRAVCTSREFGADSPDSTRIMSMTGTDQRYIDYCVAQRCFRARLTPKPWRIGCSKPPNLYPRITREEDDAFQEWLVRYEARSGSYSTCRFLESVGDPGGVSGELSIVIERHDAATGALSDLPLEPKEYRLHCSVRNQDDNHFKVDDHATLPGLSWKPGHPVDSPNFMVWMDRAADPCETTSVRYFRINKTDKVIKDITQRAILSDNSWGASGDCGQPHEFLRDPALECRECFVSDQEDGPGERLVEIAGGTVEVTTCSS